MESGMVYRSKERRPPIVTFPLFLRVSEILLLCSPKRHFSLPHLQSSQISHHTHVALGVGGSPFGHKERRCWANCLCNQFPTPRFPTYVITNHQRHRRTDRQTDGRHAIARPRFALHCALKTRVFYSVLVFFLHIFLFSGDNAHAHALRYLLMTRFRFEGCVCLRVLIKLLFNYV